MLCINFGEVSHDVSYLRYSSGIRIVLEAVLLKLLTKLAPGWAVIRVNFDPIQEIGPKVGGGCPFVSGPFFARLRYSFSLFMWLLKALVTMIRARPIVTKKHDVTGLVM